MSETVKSFLSWVIIVAIFVAMVGYISDRSSRYSIPENCDAHRCADAPYSLGKFSE